MDPDTEDPDNSDNMVLWSGSDGSQEICVESYNEDDTSDEVYPETARIPESDTESRECWESECEQRSLPEVSYSEEDISYKDVDDDPYCTESRESITNSPHIQTSPSPLSSHQERSEPKSLTGKMSVPHSPSSSSPSSLSSAADMTLALTLSTQAPLGASNRQRPETVNRRVESSEEGGSSEAPPASVFFGISDEGAEQAEKWNSESDLDLCRPGRHRARYTRHNESQSERHIKETKSKCKRIALLLTDAPDPQNKGALLFKKRRQRVKKFTLVSYGTSDNQLDNKDQREEEAQEVGYNFCNFVATSDSEIEEEYSICDQRRHLRLNWESLHEMEALPKTKGKGVLMFAQRRKRMDEIVSEHEELRSKGLPVEASVEPEPVPVQNTYNTKETYDQANYTDSETKQHVDYQENIQQMNHPSNVPKPLVPNRTAKPFGFQVSASVPVMSPVPAPVAKKPEARFKVPVPINTSPHVWSPTGDIIASRDERISVPAIKTGILPESKRKSGSKQTLAPETDLQLQRKGDRRSYIESEEDCFSLGAEACNFMQPRTVKLKNPPPVAPKPAINPNCPPWITSPSSEPYIPPRSPVSQPSHSPAGPHSQHYLQPHDWAQPQQMAKRQAQDQTQATLQTNAWAPVSPSSQLHLQPTTNSWSPQQPQSPVSMQAHSPSYSPHHLPSPSMNKLESAPNSVSSCPPQTGKAYIHASKPTKLSLRGRFSDKGISQAGDGKTMAGKGAELFAKRQSRMEKYVVDSETVQASRARSTSPTSSLPNSWRYSSNIRAPPPLSYNPLLAPFYPPAAAKQPPSTSPKIKPKTKQKPKAVTKHLNPLDIMKHQPYQLDSSLFKYEEYIETKSPSPKPPSKFEVTKNLKQKSSQSHNNVSELASQSKSEASAKSPGLVSSHISSAHQNARSAERLVNDKHVDEKLPVTPAADHTKRKQAPSGRPESASSQLSSTADSISAAYSSASLIARGTRQMAPRPKFSAKKPAVPGKQWKPVLTQ